MSKYPRTYHLPWSKGATSDDKIHKSIDSLIGIDVVITEKLDGSNSAITKDGVYGRSHIDFSKNPWDKEVWNLFRLIGKDLSENVYLFGENMEGIHSIEYKNLNSFFYLFGVRDSNIWISWEEVEEYSYILNIPTVPILWKGIINSTEDMISLTNKLILNQSKLGGEIEGIVIRNSNNFHNDDFEFNTFSILFSMELEQSNITLKEQFLPILPFNPSKPRLFSFI
jgi:hypothetical protein